MVSLFNEFTPILGLSASSTKVETTSLQAAADDAKITLLVALQFMQSLPDNPNTAGIGAIAVSQVTSFYGITFALFTESMKQGKLISTEKQVIMRKVLSLGGCAPLKTGQRVVLTKSAEKFKEAGFKVKRGATQVWIDWNDWVQHWGRVSVKPGTTYGVSEPEIIGHTNIFKAAFEAPRKGMRSTEPLRKRMYVDKAIARDFYEMATKEYAGEAYVARLTELGKTHQFTLEQVTALGPEAIRIMTKQWHTHLEVMKGNPVDSENLITFGRMIERGSFYGDAFNPVDHPQYNDAVAASAQVERKDKPKNREERKIKRDVALAEFAQAQGAQPKEMASKATLFTPSVGQATASGTVGPKGGAKIIIPDEPEEEEEEAEEDSVPANPEPSAEKNDELPGQVADTILTNYLITKDRYAKMRKNIHSRGWTTVKLSEHFQVREEKEAVSQLCSNMDLCRAGNPTNVDGKAFWLLMTALQAPEKSVFDDYFAVQDGELRRSAELDGDNDSEQVGSFGYSDAEYMELPLAVGNEDESQ